MSTLVKIMEVAKMIVLKTRAAIILGLVRNPGPKTMLTRWVRKLAPIETRTMLEPQNLSDKVRKCLES